MMTSRLWWWHQDYGFKKLYFSYFQLLYVSPFKGTILSTAICRIWSCFSVKFITNFACDSSSKFQKCIFLFPAILHNLSLIRAKELCNYLICINTAVWNVCGFKKLLIFHFLKVAHLSHDILLKEGWAWKPRTCCI